MSEDEDFCMGYECDNPAEWDIIAQPNGGMIGKLYGHEMTPENTYTKPSKEHRSCRTCSAVTRQARRAARASDLSGVCACGCGQAIPISHTFCRGHGQRVKR